MKKLPLFEASATLIGTVIGAGILGIPFAIAQVGFGFGLIIMCAVALALLARHLMYAEVTLRTPHVHQLPGYAKTYLGKGAERLTLVTTFLGGYGALLAYIIGQGEVLNAILGGSQEMWSIVFFVFGIVLIYFGLNIIKRSELIMTGFVFLITIAIGIFAWNDITFSYLATWHPGNWLVPYGVLLFAFSGSVAIPQVREQLKGREKSMRKVIVYSSAAIFVVYVVFAFLVLGVTGSGTTDIATIGLGNVVGPHMILIGNLLAFFTVGTSFLTSGLAMKQMFMYDYHFPKNKAWLLTIIVPLALFAFGARNFIAVVGLVGGVLVSVQTMVMIAAYWKARKTGLRKPEISLGPLRVVGSILMVIFFLGAAMTLLSI